MSKRETFVRKSLAVSVGAGTLVGCMGVGVAIGAGIGSILPIAGTSAGGAVGLMIGGAVGGLAAKAVYDSVDKGLKKHMNNPSSSRVRNLSPSPHRRRSSNHSGSVNSNTETLPEIKLGR